jgi:hypothetical protein
MASYGKSNHISQLYSITKESKNPATRINSGLQGKCKVEVTGFEVNTDLLATSSDMLQTLVKSVFF